MSSSEKFGIVEKEMSQFTSHGFLVLVMVCLVFSCTFEFISLSLLGMSDTLFYNLLFCEPEKTILAIRLSWAIEWNKISSIDDRLKEKVPFSPYRLLSSLKVVPILNPILSSFI